MKERPRRDWVLALLHRPLGRVAVLAACVGVLAAALRAFVKLALSYPVGDLGVYSTAVRRALGGEGLYDWAMPNGLGYTYPPFSVLTFLWMGLFSDATLKWLVLALNGLLVFAAAFFSLRMLPNHLSRNWPAVIVYVVVAAWLFLSTSIQQNAANGQVNLFLTFLCLVDILCLFPRRWGGILIGVAAAIKVTPALFLIFLFVVGRRREAALATVSATLCTLVGFAFFPRQSVDYWTSLLWQSGRVGDAAIGGNHSALGVLTRAGVTSTLVWVIVEIVVLVAGLLALRQVWQRGHCLLASSGVGVLTVLVSPVSWPHHEVWLPLMVPALFCGHLLSVRLVALAIVVLNLGWGYLVEFVANASALVSVLSSLALVASVYAAWRLAPRPQGAFKGCS